MSGSASWRPGQVQNRVGQPPDAAWVQGREQRSDRAVAGKLGVGLDVVPRREHEGALVRTRMRQGQRRVVAELPE